MSKHTPGPWEQLGTMIWAPEAQSNIASLSRPRATVYVTYTPVDFGDPDREEIWANGKVLAAAPELLERLSALTEAIEGAAPDGGWCTWISDALQCAHETIAKAQGE